MLKSVGVIIALVILAAPLASEAQRPLLPPVSVVLTLDVRDQFTWLGIQHEILTTPQESQKS